MPIPKPQTDETEDDFMERCMGNEAMVDEYPEHDQRAAVCHTSWEDAHKEEGVKPAPVTS